MRWKRPVKLVLLAMIVGFLFLTLKWETIKRIQGQQIQFDDFVSAERLWSDTDSLAVKREIDVGESETLNITFHEHNISSTYLNYFTPTHSSRTQDHREYCMVFLIPSKPDDRIYRDFIRSKNMNISFWNPTEFQDVDLELMTFKIMFIVGRIKNEIDVPKNLIYEMSQHDDIFLGKDLIESWMKLRYKVLWGIKQSLQKFRYKYLVKIDQDTLVDLPHLFKGLSGMSRTETGVYSGYCRNKLHILKRYKNIDKYRDTRYCQGGAYILSRDIVEMIVVIDNETPDHFIIPEDGYVGWLVKKAKDRFNLTYPLPQLKQTFIVRGAFYPIQKHYIIFKWWFYHWIKGIEMLEKVYDCRINDNEQICPTQKYNLSTEACQCMMDDST